MAVLCQFLDSDRSFSFVTTFGYYGDNLFLLMGFLWVDSIIFGRTMDALLVIMKFTGFCCLIKLNECQNVLLCYVVFVINRLLTVITPALQISALISSCLLCRPI